MMLDGEARRLAFVKAWQLKQRQQLEELEQVLPGERKWGVSHVQAPDLTLDQAAWTLVRLTTPTPVECIPSSCSHLPHAHAADE